MNAGKMQDPDERKTELIAGLQDVRERILALASTLSESNQEAVYLGIWSSKELLAHLAGWDETNLSAAREVLAGQIPSFYEHHNKDWAAYNARLVSQYGRDSLAELVALVRETHGRLITFIQDLPASEFWNDRGIRAWGWKVTIGRLLEAERKDEEAHYGQLKRFVETGEPS